MKNNLKVIIRNPVTLRINRIKAKSLLDAISIVNSFKYGHLDSASWYGKISKLMVGDVYYGDKVICHITYNCRVYAGSGKNISDHTHEILNTNASISQIISGEV